ncbi:MAG: AbrB/MazE/SpoVT family DNA-binding domain-containing protein [Clostridia bacterium]|nr:AbrB/MazE/SpoVT family DNA-binding domain-containing protein [Clostridia bacterium]
MDDKFEGKGVVRRVDELGRIVLPREMRKMLDIREGTRLQIGIIEGDKFLLSKYMPMNNMRDYAPTSINAMQCVVEHDILITDLEQVVFSNKKKYMDKKLHGEAQDILYKRDTVVRKSQDDSKMLQIIKEFSINPICELFVPIVKDNDVVGGIIVIAMEDKCFDEGTVKVAKSHAKFLAEILP